MLSDREDVCPLSKGKPDPALHMSFADTFSPRSKPDTGQLVETLHSRGLACGENRLATDCLRLDRICVSPGVR